MRGELGFLPGSVEWFDRDLETRSHRSRIHLPQRVLR
jgi:hypothetical protein